MRPSICATLILFVCTRAVGGEEFLKFTVRAAPMSAPVVDALLVQYAEPVQVAVPAGADTATFLRKRCQSGARSNKSSTGPQETSAQQTVSVAPCSLYRNDAHIKVLPGDTLEDIALRWGLRPSAVGDLQLTSQRGAERVPALDRQYLQPGDTVFAPAVPLWTDFRVRTDKIYTARELQEKFAAVFQCGNEKAASCLNRLGVYLMQLDPPRKGDYEALWIPWLSTPNGVRGFLPKSDISKAIRDPLAGTIGEQIAELADKTHQLIKDVATVGDQPTSADTQPQKGPSLQVADGQWPYDEDLVRRIIADALKQGAQPTVIGIAEIGLASSDGLPLSDNLFTDLRRDKPHPNGRDDDGNEYVDDLIGAGGLRGNDLKANGDVALCYPGDTTPVLYQSLSTKLQRDADHGPMVASIAAGLPWRSDAALERALPKLVFFRLSDGDCGSSKLSVRGDAVIESIRYLTTRADILALSYSFSGVNGENIANSLRHSLKGEKLLVVAAGNRPTDLDMLEDCPQCLAVADFTGTFSRKVLVVGAATQSLSKATYSGWGQKSVRLYAPGEPKGAMEMLGGDASAVEPATSFAAPYAAFAAAVVRSLGMTDLPQLVQRLRLTIWPLLESNGTASKPASSIWPRPLPYGTGPSKSKNANPAAARG